jgi:hypothetical protein
MAVNDGWQSMSFRLGTLGLAAILLWSGAQHLWSFERFLVAISRFHLVVGLPAAVTSGSLITLMLAGGAGLLFDWWRRDALVFAILIFLTFTLAMGIAFLRGVDFNCGCAIGDRPVDWVSVAKPLLLLCASVFLFLQEIRDEENSSISE